MTCIKKILREGLSRGVQVMRLTLCASKLQVYNIWHSDDFYHTYFLHLSYTAQTEFSLRTPAELWDDGESFFAGDKSIMKDLD